jgi:hypothetical protein
MNLRTCSAVLASLLGAAAAPGCSSTAADPVALSYTVEFPSKSAAVATDAVQVYAFSGALDCISLIKGYGPPPTWPTPPTVQTSSVSPCALDSAAMSLPFGEYTFVAVASRAGSELLIGCAVQALDGKSQILKIPLSLFALDRVIPQSSCNLTEKCAGRSCAN